MMSGFVCAWSASEMRSESGKHVRRQRNLGFSMRSYDRKLSAVVSTLCAKQRAKDGAPSVRGIPGDKQILRYAQDDNSFYIISGNKKGLQQYRPLDCFG